METIQFYKMQGTGNDFIVIDNLSDRYSRNKLVKMTPRLCDRKYGIGADGLIALQPSKKNDYEMMYRNADGSDAGMCGNGGRCAALFANKIGFSKKHHFSVHGKTYRAEVEGETVRLTFPVTAQPAVLEGLHKNTLIQVNTGTEHIVMQVNENSLEQEEALVKTGRKLRNHAKFQPVGTNVNFFCGIRRNKLLLQTYERGVEDLTLACGTGAIASAIAWHHMQSLTDKKNSFDVLTEGGALVVTFDFDDSSNAYQHLTLAGAAHFVYKGTIEV